MFHKWKMPLPPLILLTVLCVFFFKVNVFASETEATIIVPEDYPTIQAAIDAAKDGYTIVVMPGIYKECLSISKSVRLIGISANSTIIENNESGHTVYAERVNGFTMSGFTIKGSEVTKSGIYLKRSSKNTIENITVTGCFYGIHIYDSSGNNLRNNNITGNKYNLRVWGLYLSHFLHNIDSSNVVNGQSVCYWVNQRNMIVPQNVGYVALVNCSKIVVKDLNLSNSLAGVVLAYTNNSLIKNVVASKNERGLYLVCSHNNIIVSNNFSNNEWSGISTISSSNNSIVANILANNTWQGIRLSHSEYLLSLYSDTNFISGNILANSLNGIYFEKSNNNMVSGNVVEKNMQYGIVFDQSHKNVLYKNIVKYNGYGIRVDRSNNNVLYNNVFLNNTVQTSVYEYLLSNNIWDNGYPSGGNYWNDNACVDEYSGLHQDVTGSDSIGDVPYVIDTNNQDRYPLCEHPSQNRAPKAQFDREPWECRIQDRINFRDLSTDLDGHIMLWIWNIDGICYFQQQKVTHSFEKEGNYLVMLTIFDDEGEVDTIAKNLMARRYYSYLTFSIPEHVVVGETVMISAILRSEKNFSLKESIVNFYLIDENTYELIGSFSTNSSGMATIFYTFNKAGNFEIWATYEGNQTHSESGNRQKFTVEGLPPYILGILIIGFFLAVLVIGVAKRVWLNKRKKSIASPHANQFVRKT